MVRRSDQRCGNCRNYAFPEGASECTWTPEIAAPPWFETLTTVVKPDDGADCEVWSTKWVEVDAAS